MGALMRAHDWAATGLGEPADWPGALKTTLRLLLSSHHPMFIYWGPELIQFYNDAYRATLDDVRHPAALGQRGRVCWKEAWPVIGPQIEQVMAGGGATWNERQRVPLVRGGVLVDAWWTYGFSPIEDETGVRGVLVICNDVTEEQRNRAALLELNHRLEDEVAQRTRAQSELAAGALAQFGAQALGHGGAALPRRRHAVDGGDADVQAFGTERAHPLDQAQRVDAGPAVLARAAPQAAGGQAFDVLRRALTGHEGVERVLGGRGQFERQRGLALLSRAGAQVGGDEGRHFTGAVHVAEHQEGGIRDRRRNGFQRGAGRVGGRMQRQGCGQRGQEQGGGGKAWHGRPS